ncbi:hypothetical protein SAMN05660657_03094 [Geodermatophilus amargosae]|uniref:Uncharacterized protein n=1 Tax=Geodermatophilus amargosae TaxID=1296565 RepID=A0A1I7AWL4_9ACTN|nr:hypothetical protein [Geodermatophilus amargosae]SFT79290.1 hypothetical protein SAMN05660657_03094 [Geodermatophilus amargosae]
MTQLPPLRPVHLLVLHGLGRTPARDLLRATVRQLVDDGVLTLAEEHAPGAGRPRLVLRRGPRWEPYGRAEPVAQAIARMPAEVAGDVDGWELGRVARRLARKRRLVTEVRIGALSVPFGHRLVVPSFNRWLSQFRPRHRRTWAGEEVLRRRHDRSGGAPDAVVGGGAGIHPAFDATFDSGFGGGGNGGGRGD